MFRRVVAHLSAIQDRHALHVEPLHFQYSWTVPADSVTPEAFESTYKGFSLTHDAERQDYRVSRRINGRVMISNYDPAVLSNEERFRLHEEAEEAPFNDILMDIRPGHPGGELPLHGRLRLRSFHEVLTFIGRGIGGGARVRRAAGSANAVDQGEPASNARDRRSAALPPGVGLSVELAGLALCGSPADRLPMEPEGLQPPLSVVPDERVHRQTAGAGDHDSQVTPRPSSSGQGLLHCRLQCCQPGLDILPQVHAQRSPVTFGEDSRISAEHATPAGSTRQGDTLRSRLEWC